jgi:dihydrodipicolinate synthase/N-acetylneuraminate lyase
MTECGMLALIQMGMSGGPPRSPLSPLSDAQRETLRTILVEAGIISGAGSRVPGFGKTG